VLEVGRRRRGESGRLRVKVTRSNVDDLGGESAKYENIRKAKRPIEKKAAIRYSEGA